jgi:hypothetical protein
MTPFVRSPSLPRPCTVSPSRLPSGLELRPALMLATLHSADQLPLDCVSYLHAELGLLLASRPC